MIYSLELEKKTATKDSLFFLLLKINAPHPCRTNTSIPHRLSTQPLQSSSDELKQTLLP